MYQKNKSKACVEKNRMARLGPWWRHQNQVQHKPEYVLFTSSLTLSLPHNLKTGSSSKKWIPVFWKQPEATRLGGNEGCKSNNFQAQNQTSFNQLGLDDVCKIRLSEDQIEYVVFMFSSHLNFALVFFSSGTPIFSLWGTPNMWTFHGKYCSDFSLEEGSRWGEREGFWETDGEEKSKQPNKNHRTIAKEIRALNHTRFHWWWWWVFNLPPN